MGKENENMEQKDQVILIHEDRRGISNPHEPGKMTVVSGVDKKGKPKTVAPTKQNQGKFQMYRNDSDVLLSVLVNFFKAAAWDKDVKIYKAPADKDPEELVSQLQAAIRDPYKKEHRDLLAEYELDRWDYAQSVSEKDIDWKYLEGELGVTKKYLEEVGELENLLKYRKTNLVPITFDVGGNKMQTEGRLTLYQDKETGDLRVWVRNVKKEPQLNEPFMGHEFTVEDRKNLLSTGNLGRQVELVTKSGQTFLAYISVDPQTNDLIPLSANRLEVPKFISGKELTDDQHKALVEGKAVFVEGLKNAKGELFDATLQVSAEKRRVEFSYNGVQDLTQKYERERSEILSKRGVPNQVAGYKLSNKQKEALLEGRTLYIKGMHKKGGKEQFNAYVTLDSNSGQFKFSPFDPNKVKQSDIVKEAQAVREVTTPAQGKGQEQTQKRETSLKV